MPVAFEDGKSYSHDMKWGDTNKCRPGRIGYWSGRSPMFKGLPDDRCSVPKAGGGMTIRLVKFKGALSDAEVLKLYGQRASVS